ncbi:hypothetical protein CEV33_4288 [Brucella grignonensis]|uniref:Uncharacterized protein n=1 Tax=Brucella grignonensis TaxID=94627 RepID=A0A256FNE4_9HYPH|nr:hypothetical protein CEV33_4288 [Brucella grignonensis]
MPLRARQSPPTRIFGVVLVAIGVIVMQGPSLWRGATTIVAATGSK